MTSEDVSQTAPLVKEHGMITIMFYPNSDERREAAMKVLSRFRLDYWKVGEKYLRKNEVRQLSEEGLDSAEAIHPDTYRLIHVKSKKQKETKISGNEPIITYAGWLESENYTVPFQVDVLPVNADSFLWLSGNKNVDLKKDLKYAEALVTDLPEKKTDKNYLIIRNNLTFVENANIMNSHDARAIVIAETPDTELAEVQLQDALNRIDLRPFNFEFYGNDTFNGALKKTIVKIVDTPIAEELSSGYVE